MQVHLAHCYSDTCGDNTGEMPGLILEIISGYSVFLE